jgi:transposase
MTVTTTRVIDIVNPTEKKISELYEIAQRSANVRNEIWRQYGSVAGLSKMDYPRQVRDKCVKEGNGKRFQLQARQWKIALESAFGTVKTLWSNAKGKVKQNISSHKDMTKEERHYCFYILKCNDCVYKMLKHIDFEPTINFKGNHIRTGKIHNYLRRQLRKYKGTKPVQRRKGTIELDENMYDLYEDKKGRIWLGIMSLKARKRIHLLLSSAVKFKGNIRIVLRGKKVEVHYHVKEECPKAEPEKRQKIVGIDKGFTEVLTDSDGNKYGENLGEFLRKESERLSEKNKKRNKIRAIAKKAEEKGNYKKAERIKQNNLGKKKYNRKKWQMRKVILTYIATAFNVFFKTQKPDLVIGEALSFVYNGNGKLPKKVKRYFSFWLKGIIQNTIKLRCLRNGVTYVPVNAAYTSQVCSWCGRFGKRSGDTFHCHGCGRVVDGDYNGARNVLMRYFDPDIGLFTPFKDVKRILEARFQAGETVHPGLEILYPQDNPRANNQLCTCLGT